MDQTAGAEQSKRLAWILNTGPIPEGHHVFPALLGLPEFKLLKTNKSIKFKSPSCKEEELEVTYLIFTQNFTETFFKLKPFMFGFCPELIF